MSKISLLWPNSPCETFTLHEQTLSDLNLTTFFDYFKIPKGDKIINRAFSTVLSSKEAIDYRQDILEDFLAHEDALILLIDQINLFVGLSQKEKFASEKEYKFSNILSRMTDTKNCMEHIENLCNSLSQYTFTSQGLTNLQNTLKETLQHPLYDAIPQDIEEALPNKALVKSYTLGFNLGEGMRPKDVMLLKIQDDFPLSLRDVKNQVSDRLGLHYDFNVTNIFKIVTEMGKVTQDDYNPYEALLKPCARQIILFYDRFIAVNLEVLLSLKSELEFYRLGCQIVKTCTKAGLPICKPEMMDGQSNLDIKSCYNMNLATEMMTKTTTGTIEMVCNDITFNQTDRLFILTGANRGGKTTFTQALGQLQYLAQIGLYVPAKKAQISPVDGILTLFPVEESATSGFGRLGEECHRFSQLFDNATSNSLVLMNESFAGTSHHESLHIAKDAVKALKALGCFVLFNTHLHELAAQIPDINSQSSSSSQLISLVTGVEAGERSYLIQVAPPLGHSYAMDMAKKYGVTFEQLISTQTTLK